MTFICDEKKYAIKMLEHGFERFMNQNDLNILAKYLKYIGKNTTQIRKDLEDFCHRFNPSFNLVLQGYKIDNAIKHCKKHPLRLPASISVTQKELDDIRAINNNKYEKILFVMLVMSKYNNIYSRRGGYYCNDKFTAILRKAKVYVDKAERYKILNFLHLGGLVQAIESNSAAFRVNFVDEFGDGVIVVDDLNDIVSFYPFYCTVCGKVIERRSNSQFMCKECFEKKRREYTIIKKREYRKRVQID